MGMLSNYIINSRSIFLFGELNASITKLTTGIIMYYQIFDNKRNIELLINGKENDTTIYFHNLFLLHDLINLLKEKKFLTTCIGKAIDEYLVILSSGFNGKRSAHYCTTLGLSKNSQTVNSSQSSVIENKKNELNKNIILMSKLLILHSNFKFCNSVQESNRNMIVSPQEAVHYGIIDSLI